MFYYPCFRQYAAVVFIANNRFETGKRKLQYLTFQDFVFCASEMIVHWSYSSVGMLLCWKLSSCYYNWAHAWLIGNVKLYSLNAWSGYIGYIVLPYRQSFFTNTLTLNPVHSFTKSAPHCSLLQKLLCEQNKMAGIGCHSRDGVCSFDRKLFWILSQNFYTCVYCIFWFLFYANFKKKVTEFSVVLYI